MGRRLAMTGGGSFIYKKKTGEIERAHTVNSAIYASPCSSNIQIHANAHRRVDSLKKEEEKIKDSRSRAIS